MKVTNEQATLIRNNVECTIIMDRVSSIDIASDLLEARAQRDELLTALNRIKEQKVTWAGAGYQGGFTIYDAVAIASSAIAKVEADK